MLFFKMLKNARSTNSLLVTLKQQLTSVETKDKLELIHIALLLVQKKLVDAILAPLGLTFDEEVCQRNTAIGAVTRYCGI
jgi:hypothetical protein